MRIEAGQAGRIYPRIRPEERERAFAILRENPKYARFIPRDDQLLIDRFVVKDVDENIASDRSRRSKLLMLTGTKTRDKVQAESLQEAPEVEALIKAYEAFFSEVFRERKKWQKRLRERKKAEASENPVTRSGQIRLI